MRSAHWRRIINNIVLLGLLSSACSTVAVQPVSSTAQAASSPVRIASPTSAPRSPMPPPTRRASPATPMSQASAMPSLTPLPPPFVYVFPIQPVNATSFADGVKGHGYPATDLFAQVGTRFVAVTNGVVEFVSMRDEWDPEHPDPAKRSGLAVAILGDDGLRYYGSHLSGIAEGIRSGVRVRAGQVLGYVGATGDARGKDAHLHFGISHPTTPDDWETRRGEVNPYPYLLAWKEGRNLTPKLQD